MVPGFGRRHGSSLRARQPRPCLRLRRLTDATIDHRGGCRVDRLHEPRAAAAESTTGTPGKPRVALVLKTLNSPFFIDMQKGAEEAAKKLNVTLVVQAADREIDVERQMQIIENLMQTGVNALAVTPSGSREVVPAIKKANDAKIPVVIVDTKVDPAAATEAGIKTVSFVGSDNFEGGRVAASTSSR